MIEPRRQPGSASCFVCGTANTHGLGAVFYDDGERVWTELERGRGAHAYRIWDVLMFVQWYEHRDLG